MPVLPLNNQNLPYPDPLHPIIVHFVIAMVFFSFFCDRRLAVCNSQTQPPKDPTCLFRCSNVFDLSGVLTNLFGEQAVLGIRATRRACCSSDEARGFVMNSQPLDEFGLKLGANGLPYEIPLHPNLVHLTLGLFIVASAFDIAGALFPIERFIFKFLALPAIRSGFFDVGWYNLLGAAVVTFFTVAAGFFELC